MRYIYTSKPGKKGERGKPLNIGMNKAKRVARSADERDQLTVLATLGTGLPRQHSHHQQLVRSRHRYYSEIEVKATEFAPHFKHASGAGPREAARRVRYEQRRAA